MQNGRSSRSGETALLARSMEATITMALIDFSSEATRTALPFTPLSPEATVNQLLAALKSLSSTF